MSYIGGLTPLQQKKQEEKNIQKVRALLRLPANKKCFDCPTKSPFFVNVSVNTFVCSRCSGLVREVGHRVKSISASTFSGQEVVALQQGGNEIATSIWLNTYRMDNVEPETDNDVRSFMRQKYYEHKWLDRDALQAQTERIRTIVSEMFTDEGFRRRGVKTPPLPSSTTNGGVAAPTPLPKPTRPASLQLTRSAWKPEISSPTTSSSSSVDPSSPLTLREPMSAREPSGSSPVSSGGFALPPSSPVPVTPTNMDQYTPRRTSQPPLPQYHQQQQEQQSPQQQKQQPPLPLSSQPSSPLPQHHQQQQTPRQPITPTSSIFSELAGLQPESTKSARRATYTGGILTPSTPNATSPTSLQFPSLFQITTPTTSTTLLNNNNNNTTTTTTTTSSTQQQASNDPFKIFQQQQQKASENTKPEDDPYAALRGLKISSPPEPPKPQQPSPQAQTQPDIPNFHERQDSDEMSWTEFSTSTGDADFGDFASPPPAPAPELKSSNAFGDLDPIAQMKRSSYRV